MDKLTYLKHACLAKCYYYKAWVISVFAVTQEDPTAYKSDSFPFRMVRTPTSLQFLDQNQQDLITITDADPTAPLLKFLDVITIDESWCPNVSGQITTTVGNLLFNLIVMDYAFGTKIPFQTGKVNIRKIESLIAKRLADTPTDTSKRDPDKIYVDEYIKFVDALSFLNGIAMLCIEPGTEKVITPPDGIEEFKAQLVKEYGAGLSDPLVMAEFEKKLKDFDEAYLKDDPANNVFLDGKVKNVGRKKMFLTMGGEAGFSDGLKVTPVINSLDEGWPKESEQLAAMMNGSRFGSYSRGHETQKGGTTYKVFMRAGSNLKVLNEDCQTQFGISKTLQPNQVVSLVGRLIKIDNQWVRITSEEQAKTYLHQPIVVRSPMYCTLPGDRVCKECVGERLAANPEGISSALTEVSAIVMTANMKLMHGTVLATTRLKLTDVFS